MIYVTGGTVEKIGYGGKLHPHNLASIGETMRVLIASRKAIQSGLRSYFVLYLRI